MGPVPDSVGHVRAASQQTAARALVRDLIATAGLSLSIGAAVAIAALLITRVSGVSLAWPWLVSIPLAVSLVVAGTITGSRRWTLSRGAHALDAHFHTQSRLVTALELSELKERSVFESLAIREGEQLARGIQPARALPIRADRWWVAAAVLTVGAVVAGLYVPARVTTATTSPVQVARKTDALREVQHAIEAIKSNTAGPAAASASQLQALADVERELAAGHLTPEDARAQGAKELTAAALSMERKVEAERARSDALRTRLAEAAAAAEKADPPAESGASSEATADSKNQNPLARALSRGDLEQAARAARDLVSQADQLTPEAKRELADDLKRLAEKIDESPSPAKQPPPSDPPRTASGASNDKPASGTNSSQGKPSAQEPSNDNSASNEQTKSGDSSTRDSQGASADKPAADQAREDSRNLSHAIQKAADELERTSEPFTPAPTAETRPDSNEPTNPDRNAASSNAKEPTPNTGPANQSSPQPGAERKPTNGSGSDSNTAQPKPSTPPSADNSAQSPNSAPTSGQPSNPSSKPEPQQNSDTGSKSSPSAPSQSGQQPKPNGSPGQSENQKRSDSQPQGDEKTSPSNSTTGSSTSEKPVNGPAKPGDQLSSKPDSKQGPNQDSQLGPKPAVGPKPSPGTGTQPNPQSNAQPSANGDRPAESKGEQQPPSDQNQTKSGQAPSASQGNPRNQSQSPTKAGEPSAQQEPPDSAKPGQQQTQGDDQHASPKPSASPSQSSSGDDKTVGPKSDDQQPGANELGPQSLGDQKSASPDQNKQQPTGTKPAPSESAKNSESGSQESKPQGQDSKQGESGDQPPQSRSPTQDPGKLPDTLPSASALEKMAQQFEKHAKQLSDSRMTREQAEKYRQQAQKLLEGASPQQRQQLEDLARKMAQNQNQEQNPSEQSDPSANPRQEKGPNQQGDAREGQQKDNGTKPGQGPPESSGDSQRLAGRGQPSASQNPQTNYGANGERPDAGAGQSGPRIASDGSRGAWTGDTDLLDARRSDRDGASEKTIAQWYNPKGEPGTGVEHGSPQPRQAFEQAAQGAERAIEQQAVPNQYSDFVRRVFGRYVKRAAGEAPTSPVIENAPDAKPAPKP